MVPVERAGEAEIRRAVLQRLQPSKLRPAEHGAGRYSGKACYTNWLRRADVHYIPSYRTAWSRIGRRQQSADDRIPGAIGVLSRGRHFAGNPYRTLSVRRIPKGARRVVRRV